MASMTDILLEQMGQQALVGTVADQLGIDQATAKQALRIALPVIVAGLAKNSARKKGATDLHDALQRDHDGSLLDNLVGYLGAGREEDAASAAAGEGNAILEHILDSKRSRVEREVGQETGLDPSILSRLLPLVAPLVLAYLGRMQRQKNLNPDDLAGYLNEEESQIDQRGGLPRLQPRKTARREQANPESRAGLDGLTGMLDRDGDGKLSGEAAQVGMSILRKILAGQA